MFFHVFAQQNKTKKIPRYLPYTYCTVVAWTSFGSVYIPNQWSWRLPTLLQVLPPALQLPLMLRVSESPRWLVSHNRQSEAKDFLVRFHGNGSQDSPVVSLQYDEICQEIESDKQGRAASSWLLWVQGPGNRRRLLLVAGLTLLSSWSGTSIVTNYFALALNKVGIVQPAQQTGINGGLQVFNMLVALLSATLVDRSGRRLLFILSSAIMLLAMIGFTVATEQFGRQAGGAAASGIALVVLFFFFQLGYSIGFAPLTAMYVAEICPYNLRAKGVTLHYTINSASAAAGLYANPVALENLNWKYYLVYVAILACAVLFTYFLLPETKGRTVEEVTKMFDEKSSDGSASDA